MKSSCMTAIGQIGWYVEEFIVVPLMHSSKSAISMVKTSLVNHYEGCLGGGGSCNAVLRGLPSFAIISIMKRELVAGMDECSKKNWKLQT